MQPASLIVLGPQRSNPSIRSALVDMQAFDPGARYAVVSAGWEERDGELGELEAHLGAKTVNLNLFGRGEHVFEQDPELARALSEHHARLRQLQEFYRVRLGHLLDATRVLMRRKRHTDIASLLDEEREAALLDVMRADARHAERIGELHAEFKQHWKPSQRAALAAQRDELARILDDSPALLIAGGHVLVLLNRLRLFDLLGLRKQQPIVAWSAGAMVLSERVVVFHDSPPQGAGDAEVIDIGLGLLPDLVPLPHASARLRLDDPLRVALFARRFGPSVCALLDPGARLDWEQGAWQPKNRTRRLCADGRVSEGWACPKEQPA